MSAAAPEPDHWPPDCCAILVDAQGRYLLEQRPATARYATGLLTCFGGGREPGEEPLACVRRELNEELGLDRAAIDALNLDLSVVIRSDRRLIAWFFAGAAPTPDVTLHTEPDHEACWHTWDELVSLRVSPWHIGAIRAHREGRREAIVGESFR